MSFNMANSEDQLLDTNMLLINYDLCSMLDNEEPSAEHHLGSNESSAVDVLQELNVGVNDLTLDASAPQFEFHVHDCSHSVSMSNHLLELKKKLRSNAAGSVQYNSRQTQSQLQKVNKRNKKECGATQKVRANDLHGDCIERNAVQRLLTLFQSLHEHINAELPSNQLNSVPSEYVYDLPKTSSLPPGTNVRHHVHVLCTKLERFLARLRRTLETNRNFDYNRYTECDALLNNVQKCLLAIKTFTNIELRQRAMQFISKVAFDNAERLEVLLLQLREDLKAAHIYVHIFNWEMDHEYRYSSAMNASLVETNKRVLETVVELELETPEEFSSVEQKMIKDYQLGKVISCAKEHTQFLTALVQSPEGYFSPEIIALCETHKFGRNLKPNPHMCIGELLNFAPMNFVGELPPLSPPRVNRRSHVPRINRA